jgi:uncharacterized hydrophobic protein (TIGR00271 family)
MNSLKIAPMSEAHKNDVRRSIHDGASLSAAYLLMNTLATIIASYGLFANSPAVIIGAMIVAMLLGPITGIALALVDNDAALLRRAALTLVVGVLGVMATAFIVGAVNQQLPLTDEIMARTAPNLIDLMVALAGGAAGALASALPRLSGAFIGVAIATALVPPLSTSAILLGRGEHVLAFNAFLLAFANMAAIQFASSAVMWFTGLRNVPERAAGIGVFLRRNIVSLVVLGALAAVLASNLQGLVARQLYENATRRVIADGVAKIEGAYLVEVRFEQTPTDTIVRAVVRGPKAPTPADVRAMEDRLPTSAAKTRNELRIRFVPTQVIGRDGLLYQDEAPGEGAAE